MKCSTWTAPLGNALVAALCIAACTGNPSESAERTASSTLGLAPDPDAAALAMTFSSMDSCVSYWSTPIAGGTVGHWVQNGAEIDDPCGPSPNAMIAYYYSSIRQVENRCVLHLDGLTRLVRDVEATDGFAWTSTNSPRYGCFSSLYQTTHTAALWSECDDAAANKTRIYRYFAESTPYAYIESYSPCTADNGFMCYPMQVTPGQGVGAWFPDGWDIVPNGSPRNAPCKKVSPSPVQATFDPSPPSALMKPYSPPPDTSSGSGSGSGSGS
jgi:hypothetical protein